MTQLATPSLPLEFPPGVLVAGSWPAPAHAPAAAPCAGHCRTPPCAAVRGRRPDQQGCTLACRAAGTHTYVAMAAKLGCFFQTCSVVMLHGQTQQVSAAQYHTVVHTAVEGVATLGRSAQSLQAGVLEAGAASLHQHMARCSLIAASHYYLARRYVAMSTLTLRSTVRMSCMGGRAEGRQYGHNFSTKTASDALLPAHGLVTRMFSTMPAAPAALLVYIHQRQQNWRHQQRLALRPTPPAASAHTAASPV